MPLTIGSRPPADADAAAIAAQNAHLRRMADVLRGRGLAPSEYEDGPRQAGSGRSGPGRHEAVSPCPFDFAGVSLARLARRAMDEGLVPQGPIALEDVLPEAIAFSDRMAAAHGHRGGAEALAALCERAAGAVPLVL